MELIDTQWDVNVEVQAVVMTGNPELIDTQWDVKYDNYGIGTEIVVRINRYIVGCKYHNTEYIDVYGL